jgi:iron(III) transport system substrate-binding protein
MKMFNRFLPYLLAVCCIPVTGAAHAQAVGPVAALALYDGPDREQRLLQGARREGEVNVYTSLVVQDISDLAAAFEKKYGIKVRYWRAGSEKVVQRVITEARAGRFDFDIVETNGPELESLHREKLLQKATSPHYADLVPQALRPHGEWVGTRLNMFVHIYNTKQVKKEDLPTSYQDLLNPKWKGKLGIEAEDNDWFAAIVKELGEEKGVKLFRDVVATNGMSVRKGHTLLAGLVASGEVPFGLTVYNHNAEKLKVKGAPVDWYVIQPAIIRANGVALSRKPPHSHAAVLFYDFMLNEGQSILAKGEYIPVSRKVQSHIDKLAVKFIDPAIVLDEGEKWQKLFAEIFTRQGR